MTCKGICKRHKASNCYANGQKRCQVCELFIKWDGVFCPCCGYRLRIRPKKFNIKSKAIEQESILATKMDDNLVRWLTQF